MSKTKDKKMIWAGILTIIIGISFQFIPASLPIGHLGQQVLGSIWNVTLCGLTGYYLLGEAFLEQFKHFKWKVLFWGIPLTMIVGIASGTFYNTFFGTASQNSVADVLTVQMIVLQIPFMLIGEELLSTNLLIALEKAGLSFKWASLICGILFALWHIPAYGPNILQLLITLMPVRLALNYVWKKSSSVWVSWLCHFLYDCLGFLNMLSK